MAKLDLHINPTHADISEYVELPNGLIAHRYDISGTDVVCYAVYEKIASIFGPHSSITHTKEYGWLGDVQTVALPAHLEALKPYSAERSTAVRAWFKQLEVEAERIIRAAFPQDFAEVQV